MDYVCSQRFIACETCGMMLVSEFKPIAPVINAVCDVVNLTEPGDKFETSAPVFPAHYFCEKHGRESREYSIQEIKNNVRF